MPGERARRHFSWLSEFERGLIIGMITVGWSTRRVAGQMDHSECAVRNCWEQWTREGTHTRKTGSGVTRKTTRREDRADQLKRQMPSCHSVHDLVLAVQDMWAHLPHDNIRCLIYSMPDRVAACIAAGGGPTRY
ncbi:uncharacterized protein TNCV_1191301 [Trichonephila clavipes]|nr:uncharacterized protein TNCV_1191301 [Trichonephila clavipes]